MLSAASGYPVAHPPESFVGWGIWPRRVIPSLVVSERRRAAECRHSSEHADSKPLGRAYLPMSGVKAPT